MISQTESVSSIIHITPKIEELIPNKILKCPENDCNKEFSNYGNLQMHLIRHHRKENLSHNNYRNDEGIILQNNTESKKIYFCPIENCQYNESTTIVTTNKKMNKKFFNNLKYLRQHYQKVHMEKLFKCDKCEKKFQTEKQKQSHICVGIEKFICDECGWDYKSREALLTHSKRKNHKITINNKSNLKSFTKYTDELSVESKIPIQRLKSTENNTETIQTFNTFEVKEDLGQSTINMPVMIIIKTEMQNKMIQTDTIHNEFTSDLNDRGITMNNERKSKSTKRGNRNSSHKSSSKLKKIKHVKIQTIESDNSFNPCSSEMMSSISSGIKLADNDDDDDDSKIKENFFNLDLYNPSSSHSIPLISDNIVGSDTKLQSHPIDNQNDNLNNLNFVSDNSSITTGNIANDNANDVNNSTDVAVNNCFDEQFVSNSGFCDIETQTEFDTDSFIDQMLYANMHTQTCDEFLSVLADIQTQTNWSGIINDDPNENGIDNDDDHDHRNMISTKISSATSPITSGPHDELLVSTETQTSFTQCLLECTNTNNKYGSCLNSNINGITQHTQTCDMLLEGLFDGHENDLISGFQSTHTQT